MTIARALMFTFFSAPIVIFLVFWTAEKLDL